MDPSHYHFWVGWSERDQVYIARTVELPGITAHGNTQLEALTEVQIALAEAIEMLAEHGDPIPPPMDSMTPLRYTQAMPAPTITLSRGSVTLTMDAVPKNGFEIRGTIGQPTLGGDWTITLSLVKVNPGGIASGDETATFALTSRVPFNEAPGETEIQAKLQELVNHVFDHFVPAP